MKIVAFMQNCWFPPGTDQRHIDKYHQDQDFHRRVLAMSMSGKRLVTAFGWLYDRIWWDNASKSCATVASGRYGFDLVHMRSVLKRQSPKLVITFGAIAGNGVMLLDDDPICNPSYEHLSCHHPNARHKTQQDLNDFAALVWRWIEHNLGAERSRIESGEVPIE
jgi:hypothetical protein